MNGDDMIVHVEDCLFCQETEERLEKGTITKEEAYKQLDECFTASLGE